ncbi:unnamed protein product [Calypogeia fissa]
MNTTVTCRKVHLSIPDPSVTLFASRERRCWAQIDNMLFVVVGMKNVVMAGVQVTAKPWKPIFELKNPSCCFNRDVTEIALQQEQEPSRVNPSGPVSVIRLVDNVAKSMGVP